MKTTIIEKKDDEKLTLKMANVLGKFGGTFEEDVPEEEIGTGAIVELNGFRDIPLLYCTMGMDGKEVNGTISSFDHEKNIFYVFVFENDEFVRMEMTEE